MKRARYSGFTAIGILVVEMAILPVNALAQAYPAKTVRFIITYPTGGGSDFTARPIAQRLTEKWGQPVVVESRPGGSAMIGTEFVVRSPADGYTLMIGSSGNLAVAPALGLGDPTIGWVNAAFRQMKRFEAPEYARAIRTPILVFEAGRENVVSNPALERFVQNLNNGALVPIAGAKHELLMERDDLREQFWRAFDAFIPGERRA